MNHYRCEHGIVTVADSVYVIAGYDGWKMRICERFTELDGWVDFTNAVDPLTLVGVAERNQILYISGLLESALYTFDLQSS
jgi:tetrahydromethanopterin S-methyltransferase subunit B